MCDMHIIIIFLGEALLHLDWAAPVLRNLLLN